MARVVFEHVTKRFGEVIAVDDLCLEAPDQEFLVLVGPSGCGKTTTLRLLAGLEEFESGTIIIGDRVVNYVEPKDRDVAMVFQNYALYPHMTVYENLAFCLKARRAGKGECDRRVREAAEILSIQHLLDRQPKQLSDGQRQRVALGRAIVREPQVFLMDEPLSNLDAKQRAQLRAELARIHRHVETTFIYVTHDQLEAMTMGTRIAVMKDGKVLQVDTPRNVYDCPKNLFVAGFVGSPAMNLFDVKVVGTAEEMHIQNSHFRFRVPPIKAQGMSEYLGKQVIFGIRPEDVHDRQYEPSGITAEHLTLTVDVTELIGNEVFLYLLNGSKSVIARVDRRNSARVGQQVDVAFDMNYAHFFDRDTQVAIR
jgi:multiple sugar transport system ATP-binding protein